MFSVKHAELLMQTPGLYEEFHGFYTRLNAFLREAHNDDGTLVQEPAAEISDLGLAVGTIVPYAGSSVPTGWLLCDGTAVSRATYSTLFGILSTTFGVGDGATTFNLPDIRQRFPLGKAASGTGSTLGSTGGTIDHLHTGPSHTHTGPSHTHSIAAGGTGVTGAPSATTEVQSGTGATVASSTHTHTGPSHDHGAATGAEGTGNTGAAGAGNTGTANPPFVALNFIILYA